MWRFMYCLLEHEPNGLQDCLWVVSRDLLIAKRKRSNARHLFDAQSQNLACIARISMLDVVAERPDAAPSMDAPLSLRVFACSARAPALMLALPLIKEARYS